MLLPSSLSRTWRVCVSSLLLTSSLTNALTLDITSEDSIRSNAKTLAASLFSYYTNQPATIVGLLPYTPYYWWESGAMWGTLINYWHYTGDTTYNSYITEGIQYQVGQYNDFEPANQTFDLGNDDQAFWAFTAMEAAEYGFPNPPSTQPQWLALAQAVFNRQAARWDATTCNGGLRWQIFYYNNGWDYKNSPSNGALFNIAARLARYTGNTTFSDWANKIWDWEIATGLIRPDLNYNIYDGTTPSINCSQIDHLQWSYTTGMFLHGAAVMWNLTETDTWKERTNGLLKSTSLFMRENAANTTNYVLWEIECEAQGNCDTDQLSFKGYLARWMAATAKVAPYTYSYVMDVLQASAQAAATSCTGGTNGTSCGSRWYTGSFDGTAGAGQQLCALEVVQGLLVGASTGTVTSSSGGNSTGDSNAGTGRTTSAISANILNITKGDRAGAWFLTALIAVIVLSGGVWMIL